MTLPSRSWIGTVTATFLALGGCAVNGGDKLVDACPPTQIAVPSDSIGHSDEEGRIRFVVTMEKLSSSCRIDGDQIIVDLTFNVKAEKGPVFEDNLIELTYYIATVGPKREIVDKELLDFEVALDADQIERTIREELTLQLPASTDVTGSNYNLYLGFQPGKRS